MKKFMIPLISIILFYANIQAHEAQDILDRNDRCFLIENKGQWPEEVKYLSKIDGMNAWITDFGVVYDYYHIIREKKPEDPFDKFKMHHHQSDDDNTRIKGHVVRAVLDGVSTKAKAIGNGKQEGYYNYFIGNDPDKWASEIGLFNEVEIQDIYDGIDIRYYYENGLVRYDYKVSAGADLSKIQFHLEGADGFNIDNEGELLIRTSIGDVRHGRLFAYQMDRGMEQKVECRFELKGEGAIGIMAMGYDRTKELIIDPLVYSTFIGGAEFESCRTIALDNDSNVYISGYTRSPNYPTTAGAYDQGNNNYNKSVFVTKLNASGAELVYSTFIEGRSEDLSWDIDVDSDGNAYITGYTESIDFPTTTNAFDRNHVGTVEIFITKLNTSGTDLVYSTFIGGKSYEYGYGISIDPDGNAYITGSTFSVDYPTTTGAYDNSHNDSYYGNDAFITKLNSDGTGLVYSTFIGGESDDRGYAIAIDYSGNAYITGYSESSNYPAVTNAYDETYNGGQDAFVTKLNADGTELIYSTFIGGVDDEYGDAIEVDNNGNVYVTGDTKSTDYPTTTGSYDETHNGVRDVFVTKLNGDATDLVYSTYIGGLDIDGGTSIAIDQNGYAYVTGYSKSTNFPTSSDAYDQTHNGDSDVFITGLDVSGTILIYSTFIGGTNWESSYDISLDEHRNVYLTGDTSSPDYPVTSNSYDQDINDTGEYTGASDAFVTKLHIEPTAPSQITITFPNGGERLAVGTPYTIAWDTDENIGNVKIEISTTGGSTWWDVMQGASTSNDGSYQYTPVVENISDHCLFRITSIENSAVSDQSDGEFRIVSLPKPTYLANEIPSYLTEPQIDGILDDQVWTTIFEVDSLLFGGFSLAWTLPWVNYPDNLVTWKACWSSNTNCLYVAVEVEDDIKGDYDNEPNDPAPYLPFNDESLEFFLDGDHQGDSYGDRYDLAQHWRVSGKNVRNLTDYPNVNEYAVYSEGDFITGTHYSDQDGNWTCEAKIKIYDIFNSNPKNLQIGDMLGFELWYNDSDNDKYSGQCYLRDHQTGWAYAGPAYDDASFFGDIILTEGDNSNITVLSPNGGEDIGCSTTITWTSIGTSANVKLEYYCNDAWNTIINSTSNDGSYLWNIPSNTVCSSKIKIIDAANTGCWDMSDDFFDIRCEGPCNPPYIKAGDVEGAPGMDIQIPIHIKGNTKLVDAFGFEFNFCADKLHLLEVVKGSLTTDFNFFQYEETALGKVTIGGFHTTPIPLNSDGVIAIIKLHVDACALGESCILTISGLVDDLIGMNICNGTFSRLPCHLGDVNNDGSLTPGDALCAFQIYLHGGTLPSGTACDNECALFAADLNCTPDGITPGDALYIFQGYLGGKTLPLDCKPTALPKENSDLMMTITSAEGKPGEEVVFAIDMDRPESIQAFGLDLGYPAELLTFVGIRATGITGKWDVLNGQINVDGVVTIGGFNPAIQEDQNFTKLLDVIFKVNEEADGIGNLWLFNMTDDLARADCRAGRFSTAIEGIRRLGGLDIPDTYRLEQNYPNPFNMDTEIMYQLPEAGFVTVTIYNSVGHQIRSLVNQHQEPGKYAAQWNGKDDLGNDSPSGVYIYQIKTGAFSDSKKMILIK